MGYERQWDMTDNGEWQTMGYDGQWQPMGK